MSKIMIITSKEYGKSYTGVDAMTKCLNELRRKEKTKEVKKAIAYFEAMLEASLDEANIEYREAQYIPDDLD